MSIGEPFTLRPLSSLLYRWEWSDWGTGGIDWSFMSVSTTPTGYAPIGDLIYQGYLGDNVGIDPARAWNVQVLFVRNDRPDVARPCTDYIDIGTLSADTTSKMWRPTCSDPNFIGVGDVCLRGTSKPIIGKYFCVHRKYLIDAGKNAFLLSTEDGVTCYRTIPSTNIFRRGDPQVFGLRDDANLQACCTGSGTMCELWTKGSTSCQTAMTEFCSANDIKPGGKCEDWCTRDPISCDKVKNKFCMDHPDDPFCDCINALDRPEHAAFIKDKETIYAMSIPACYFNKCKQGPYKVFTTTDMIEAQQGQRCSQDLKLIDQQIKILGDNNVLNTNQNVTENPTIINPPTETKSLGYSQNQLFMFVLLIIIILSGYYGFIADNGRSYMQQPIQIQP